MRTLLRGLAASALALAAAIPVAGAQPPGDVAVSAAWTRAVGATAPTAAGYMTLRNRGAVPDRLVGAETLRAPAPIEMLQDRPYGPDTASEPFAWAVMTATSASTTSRGGSIPAPRTRVTSVTRGSSTSRPTTGSVMSAGVDSRRCTITREA